MNEYVMQCEHGNMGIEEKVVENPYPCESHVEEMREVLAQWWVEN